MKSLQVSQDGEQWEQKIAYMDDEVIDTRAIKALFNDYKFVRLVQVNSQDTAITNISSVKVVHNPPRILPGKK